MSLKEKLQKDFIKSMKDKDTVKKSTLSGIKAKITEAEKVKGQGELNDDSVTRVLLTAAKQRNNPLNLLKRQEEKDLIESETAELNIIEEYLPKEMTNEEISKELVFIMGEMNYGEGNRQRIIGQTIGAFNKNLLEEQK